MAMLEPLEPNPFALLRDEQAKCMANHMDAISGQCTTDFHLGIFFDGTNNNKYRDQPKQAHSNVARLFDIFEVNKYQARIYVPGIGTPFEEETSDTGRGYDATAGLAAGWGGEARINWALLQVASEIYRLYYGQNLSLAMGTNDLAVVKKISTDINLADRILSAAGRDEVEQLSNATEAGTIGFIVDTASIEPRHQARKYELERRRKFVAEKLKSIVNTSKPKIQRIRLSVFGFSRGAAEARVFSNWLEDALDDGMMLAGIPVDFMFLGIFDTVASVGLAHSTLLFDGHGGWGKEEFLRIPKYVDRTVHLVSAHEVRGSFPLDKAVGKNCLELAYPGVHTDVGGAYEPGDQGRGCRADGTPDDSTKLSQITLAKMYREAVAAGVPLNPSATNLAPRVKDSLNISPELVKAFNDYVAAVNPLIKKRGEGTTGAAHVQYGEYLRWRRLRLASGTHAFENQRFFERAQRYSAQCAQDLLGANEELREEAQSLAKKENSLSFSDGWMARILRNSSPPAHVKAEFERLIWGQKVKDWKEVKAYWNDTSPVDARIIKLCDDYIHDSRAWFKPTVDNEAVWLRKQKLRMEQLKQQDAEWRKVAADLQRDLKGTLKRYTLTADGGDGEIAPLPVAGQDRADLDRYLKDGSLPLQKSGREPSSVLGYLRWRTHFAPELTFGERAQAAWDHVAAVPGKVAQKAKDAVHSAEDGLAHAARRLLDAGQESLERSAKDALQRFLGNNGMPRL